MERRLDIAHIEPSHLEAVALPHADHRRSERKSLRVEIGPVAAVETRSVDHRHRLKPTALGELAADLRKETIENPVTEILGEIQNRPARIEGDRLMKESSERRQRLRLDESSLGRRGHLEAIAMRTSEDLRVARVGALLAGDPRAPRRVTAGAIDGRSAEREELALDRARRGVVQHGRRAAEAGDARSTAVVEPLGVDPSEELELRTERPDRHAHRRIDLVVSHEKHASVAAVKRAHAVMLSRHDEPVVHLLAGRGEDPLRESGRQGERAAQDRSWRHLRWRRLGELVQWRAGVGGAAERSERERRSAGAKESPAGEAHGNIVARSGARHFLEIRRFTRTSRRERHRAADAPPALVVCG
jgi:hypothetical protein